jgi:uncharacterized UPF0160 family protein
MAQLDIIFSPFSFYPNDVFSIFIRKEKSQFKHSKVIHSSDESIIQNSLECGIGFDYNHESREYDFHQDCFAMKFNDSIKSPLSYTGLIYLHYEKEAIQNILKKYDTSSNDLLDDVFFHMYKSFVLEIDAISNPIPVSEGNEPLRFIFTTHLSYLIEMLKPHHSN